MKYIQTVHLYPYGLAGHKVAYFKLATLGIKKQRVQ